MTEISTYLPYLLSGFVGFGLAASAGFRVFLPLFAVSLGTYLGIIPMNENWQWLSGVPVLITTAVATLVEIFAYYIPVVDHFIDALVVPFAGIAGTLLFASQFADMGGFTHWALAIIAGGGIASIISTGFAGTRAASTDTTAGTGNFLVSSLETFGAALLPIISFALPIVGFVIALILLIIVFIFGKKIYSKLRPKKAIL